jgi:hypothetical protein
VDFVFCGRFTQCTADLASDLTSDFAQQLCFQDLADLADFFPADFVAVDRVATGLALGFLTGARVRVATTFALRLLAGARARAVTGADVRLAESRGILLSRVEPGFSLPDSSEGLERVLVRMLWCHWGLR